MYAISLFELDADLPTRFFALTETEALDQAETLDCDGDHDGIVVTNPDGRHVYWMKPVRFASI